MANIKKIKEKVAYHEGIDSNEVVRINSHGGAIHCPTHHRTKQQSVRKQQMKAERSEAESKSGESHTEKCDKQREIERVEAYNNETHTQ